MIAFAVQRTCLIGLGMSANDPKPTDGAHPSKRKGSGFEPEVEVAAGLRHRGGENPAVGIGGRLRRRHRRAPDETRYFYYPSMRTIKAGQDRAHERRSMSTVKNALTQKSGALIHVRCGDMEIGR